MVMLGIGLYRNTFSHIYVQHQHYPIHDTIFLSIFFYWLFFCIFTEQLINVSDAPYTYILETL